MTAPRLYRIATASSIRRISSLATPASGRLGFRAASAVAVGLVVGVAYSADWPLLPLRSPLHLDAPAPPVSHRIDPATSLSFPLELSPISLARSDAPLHLAGLGVRTVSFLRVQVYCAGFYVQRGGFWQTEGMGNEETMDKFLSSSIPCAIRIVPTRNTGFDHLRDGLVRAMQARIKMRSKAGEISEVEAQRLDESITKFKSFFATRTAKKGEEMVLVKTAAGELGVEFEGALLGKLHDPWLAKELFLIYFQEKGASSPKMKESVMACFAETRASL